MIVLYVFFVYVLYAGVRLVTSIDSREWDALQSATLFLQNGSSAENSGRWIVRCSSTTSLVSMMSSICSFICKQFANTSFLNCAKKRETNDVSGLLVEYK